jgi:hypothetical protein
MANAITENLEMVDVAQVKEDMQVQVSQANFQESNGVTRQVQHMIPKQGETLRTDLQITGTKFFTDASWKIKNVPGSKGAIATGMGVYIQIKEDNFEATAMIQASTQTSASVLQAEAEALSFAVRVASKLQLQHQTFLTDNITLARAAASSSATHPQVPWEIRRHIADYMQFAKTATSKVYHIKRDLNGVAHNCAHQALRQSLSQPIFSCSNSAHRDLPCPIHTAVQQLQSHNAVIHAVYCL